MNSHFSLHVFAWQFFLCFLHSFQYGWPYHWMLLLSVSTHKAHQSPPLSLCAWRWSCRNQQWCWVDVQSWWWCCLWTWFLRLFESVRQSACRHWMWLRQAPRICSFFSTRLLPNTTVVSDPLRTLVMYWTRRCRVAFTTKIRKILLIALTQPSQTLPELARSPHQFSSWKGRCFLWSILWRWTESVESLTHVVAVSAVPSCWLRTLRTSTQIRFQSRKYGTLPEWLRTCQLLFFQRYPLSLLAVSWKRRSSRPKAVLLCSASRRSWTRDWLSLANSVLHFGWYVTLWRVSLLVRFRLANRWLNRRQFWVIFLVFRLSRVWLSQH